MKIGIVSESPADEAIIKLIVNSLTGCQNEIVSSGRQRAGGWSAALGAVAIELRYLHYNSEAHALITIIDSNGSLVHDASHLSIVPECRVCRLNEELRLAKSKLKTRHLGYQVESLAGLAVPALEARLLYGTDAHIVEHRFERDLKEGRDMVAIRKELKRKLYNTETPSVALQKDVGARAAERICSDLPKLEAAFPKGFGFFAQKVRELAAKYP